MQNSLRKHTLQVHATFSMLQTDPFFNTSKKWLGDRKLPQLVGTQEELG
ncbi:hypothetical protein [Paenibacillus alvei]|nr:hypothetical protein [Paenibacillus alvei]